METPASRLAERNRLRELRAERLARLRPTDPGALEEFLRALTGPAAPPPPPSPARSCRSRAPSAKTRRPRDLGRLPGAGPGLVWALQRAGLRSLADLARLGPADLAARLGPIGRLVPAAAWIDAARADADTRLAGTD